MGPGLVCRGALGGNVGEVGTDQELGMDFIQLLHCLWLRKLLLASFVLNSHCKAALLVASCFEHFSSLLAVHCELCGQTVLKHCSATFLL